MKRLFPKIQTPHSALETRLLGLGTLFLFLYSLILTLSPAVRIHSWAADYRWSHWAGWLIWVVGFALIYRRLNRFIPERDPYLLPIIALLCGWGLLTVWRLDSAFGLRQAIWLAFGLLAIEAGLHFPQILRILRRYKYIWLSLGLLLTILTFFFGRYPTGEGPQLWLGCCGFYVQPSEPLKLLLIIYLAAYLADQLPVSFGLTQLVIPTLIATGAAALILVAQRDLGTAILIVAIYTLLMFMASGKRRILIVSFLVIVVAGIAGYFSFDVIRLRVDAWINPWADPLNRSYQIVQSLIAIASGGILGTGPGLGSPGLVPIAHSDFIMAAIAEENGYLGLTGLLLLYFLLVVRGFKIGLQANNLFSRLLAFGISIYLGAQAILIMGGNLRLLPLTGVTLPFVSYGGSSLFTSFVAFALLLLVDRHDETAIPPAVNPRPVLLTSALFGLAFLALAFLGGYWSVFRGDTLKNRSDNLRWIIQDRYVLRGSILDRHNEAIAETTGTSGAYVRQLNYPQLSSTIGYISSQFGRAGLEDSLNSYLVGLQANTSSSIWLADLLYSQPPIGLNVRLTLDLNLQKTTDELLGNHTGAVVLLNAKTGEILAIASHPTFNSNQIDNNGAGWAVDESAPLVNRATQGEYPIGTAIGPFLYTYISSTSSMPSLNTSPSYMANGVTLTCAHAPLAPLNWGSVVSAGCPAALAGLSNQVGVIDFQNLYRALGFYTTPDVYLPVNDTTNTVSITDARLEALGFSELRVSPLQMALAAASLSNGGKRPGPMLAASVQTPQSGWVVLPNDAAQTVFTSLPSTSVLSTFSNGDLPAWEATGTAQDEEQQFSWYIGGTLPNWTGQPMAIAVLLEEDNADMAQSIGENVLKQAVQPSAAD